jgi:hypothetical protein
MNIEGRTLVEFLCDIQNLEGMQKEFLLKQGESRLFLPIYYKFYKDSGGIVVFNIYFVKDEDFLNNKRSLNKQSKYEIVITEIHWALTGGELKPLPGEKKFISCQIIDIRKDFFKAKLI